MALEPLYTVKQIADYFQVTESTVLRWIADERKNPGTGLKARLINGKYKSLESWVKDYAKVLYAEEKA
jgi:transposase